MISKVAKMRKIVVFLLKFVSCMGARGVQADTMHFQEPQLRLLEVRSEPLSQITETVYCIGARGCRQIPCTPNHY